MGAREEVSRGRNGGRVKLLNKLMLAVCAAWLFPGDVFSQVVSQEYQLKAKYLRQIPSFVEWPASASQETFRLCTLGDYPFGTSLSREVGGVSVGGRKIELRWVHK